MKLTSTKRNWIIQSEVYYIIIDGIIETHSMTPTSAEVNCLTQFFYIYIEKLLLKNDRHVFISTCNLHEDSFHYEC